MEPVVAVVHYIGLGGGIVASALLGAYAFPGSPLKKVVERWIEARVTARFDKELEAYRHRLQLEAEGVKAEYQRELHNTAIVAERRHEVCRELYRLLTLADGAIGGLWGAGIVPTFEDYSSAQLKEYMASRRFAGKTIDLIVDQWDRDRTTALQELHQADRRVDVAHARQQYETASNYMLSNALYLPEDTIALCRDLLEPLWTLLGAASMPFGTFRGETSQLKRQATERLAKVRTRLQQLLGAV